jgi:hypothetical protein
MSYASRFLALASRLLISVSNKLSIATVLGTAVVVLRPHHAGSTITRLEPGVPPAPATSAAPVELVRAKPVPLVEPPEDVVDLIASRRRARRHQQQPEPAAPVRKDSAIAAVPAPQKPAAAVPVEPKPETAQAEPPPKPDVWSDAEVIAGLRECVKLLAPIAAEVEVSQPVKHNECGTPAPMLLRRVGSGPNRLEINPPAMVNCAMVVGLHQWVEKTLQPAAQEALGSPITRLRNASGYACRGRNGSPLNADKLSEHARANAIDISGFVTADGRTIEVARHWGPTARDEREAARLAAAQDAKGSKDARKASAKAEPARQEQANKNSAIAERGADRRRGRDKDADRARIQTTELQRLGRGVADAKPIPAPALEEKDAKATTEGAFLRRLHKGACGVFGTVLGPEANDAHRDHFHLDLAHRRRSAYCQ